ncbi:MAG: UDP-3-O-acyl-N-acetylglucosamine deacetylase [Planctomycetota bacterium]
MITLNQRTIKNEITYEGFGLFSGEKVRLVFRPTNINSGINFIVSADGGNDIRIPISIKNSVVQYRRSAVGKDGVVIETIEHLMATLNGLGITNLDMEIKPIGSCRKNSLEIPNVDGSAKLFVDLLLKAGIKEQAAPKKTLTIKEPIIYNEGECSISAFPSDEEGLSIEYTFSHNAPIIGTQHLIINLSEDNFISGIATARTFCMADEVAHFISQGLGKGANYQNLLVVDKDKIVNNTLRFKDEFVRHKILDLLGDLYLLNASLIGKIIAAKSGHKQNIQFVAKLAKLMNN